MIQKPRGTADILPAQTAVWQYIEKKAMETASRYGFREIRFPTFEATELFNRGVGDTTDIVQKEMYTFTDREGRSLTLRPEGTASAARCIIENGMCSDTMPLKLFYRINCFRYEKPQAGRSREFSQFGVEMFGAAVPAADAEVIALAHAFIQSLGIRGAALHINSIGCPHCRPRYHAALKEYFTVNAGQLCDTCRTRLETNPLRILDCKNESCKTLAAEAPRMIDYLCEECENHFIQLQDYLSAADIPFAIDTSIVRGLDYYTRTVFEFIAEGIGAQSAICGGGRYDGLIASVGGPQLAGIGFAMGISRLILAMEASGVHITAENKPLLYIAPMGAAAAAKAFAMTEQLRGYGVYAECDLVGRSLKAQMKYADKVGAAYTLIIGDAELETGRAQLKNMAESSQSEVIVDDIDALRRRLGA